MRSALIPPKGFEAYMHRSDMQMVIAPVFLSKDNLEYTTECQQACSYGNYIIVDNGEYEGQAVSGRALVSVALSLEADEVVMPDVMRNVQATTDKVQLFLDQFGALSMKFMGVAQGRTPIEFQKCIDWFASQPKVHTVGIPRHSVKTVKKNAFRLDLANWIEDEFPKRFKVHFLGVDPSWMGELIAANKYAPHVRSVDSSLPFYYAMQKCPLTLPDGSLTKVRCSRPSDYFSRSHRSDASLIARNITTFVGWTNAKAPVS